MKTKETLASIFGAKDTMYSLENDTHNTTSREFYIWRLPPSWTRSCVDQYRHFEVSEQNTASNFNRGQAEKTILPDYLDRTSFHELPWKCHSIGVYTLIYTVSHPRTKGFISIATRISALEITCSNYVYTDNSNSWYNACQCVMYHVTLHKVTTTTTQKESNVMKWKIWCL